MSNPIVAALEQMAQRIGRTLSEDAGKAVEKMYRDAGKGVEDVVKRIQAVDEEMAHKLLQVAERVGREDAGRMTRGEAESAADSFGKQKLRAARGRQVAPPTAHRRSRRGFRTTGTGSTGSARRCRRRPPTR